MRHFPDWLAEFQKYSTFGEAPDHFYFWCGVSAIAGVLRRKVWFDQLTFRWYPNMYVIFVAPPGIIQKGTTANLAMDLLKKVKGIQMGPTVTTWQALVTAFAESKEEFIDPVRRTAEVMSCLTINSEELGTLIAPNDREIMDMLTHLWDCKDIDKKTKKDGNEYIENPFLNLIACTTPGWIAANLPSYMIDGGLVSRCLWVYGDKKRKYVPYPGLMMVEEERRETQKKLIADLQDMTNLVGDFSISKSAVEWGSDWYEKHFSLDAKTLDDSRFRGYIARKQAHIHKLAMVLAVARGSDLLITLDILQEAERQVTLLESRIPFVFDQMGKSKDSTQADRLVEFISNHEGVSVVEAYHHVHSYFPKITEFEAVLKGLLKSGMIVDDITSGKKVLKVKRHGKEAVCGL